jgi:predicted membrane-bound spermidine synthase
LVDLDEGMTRLARDFAPLVELNGDALADARVELIHDDAMNWVRGGCA